jgi:hypothetical protein
MAAAAERYRVPRRAGPYQDDSDLRPGDRVRIGRLGLPMFVLGRAPRDSVLVSYRCHGQRIVGRFEVWRLTRC